MHKSSVLLLLLGVFLISFGSAGVADVSNGLEVYYSFDEAGESGYTNSGATFSSEGVSGGSLVLNSGVNRISSGETNVNSLGSGFSVSLWIKPSDDGIDSFRRPLYGLSYDGNLFKVDHRNSNGIMYVLGNSEEFIGTYNVVSDSFNNDGKWYHIVSTFDNGELKNYLNGELIYTRDIGKNINFEQFNYNIGGVANNSSVKSVGERRVSGNGV